MASVISWTESNKAPSSSASSSTSSRLLSLLPRGHPSGRLLPREKDREGVDSHGFNRQALCYLVILGQGPEQVEWDSVGLVWSVLGQGTGRMGQCRVGEVSIGTGIEINRRSLIGGVAVANGAAILEQGPYNGSLWRKNSFTVTTQSIVVGF